MDDCKDCPEIRIMTEKFNSLKEDLSEIKENLKWSRRLAVTTIITLFSSIASTAILVLLKLR